MTITNGLSLHYKFSVIAHFPHVKEFADKWNEYKMKPFRRRYQITEEYVDEEFSESRDDRDGYIATFMWKILDHNEQMSFKAWTNLPNVASIFDLVSIRYNSVSLLPESD